MEKRSLVSFFCVLFVCFYNLYQWNPHYRFDLSATFFDASQSYGGMAYFQTPAYNYRNCNLFLFSVSHLLSGWKIMQLLCRQGKKGRAKKNVAVVGTAFWYFMMVLGLPFAGRMYQNQWEGFGQYTLLVSGVCAVVVCLIYLAGKIYRCGFNAAKS